MSMPSEIARSPSRYIHRDGSVAGCWMTADCSSFGTEHRWLSHRTSPSSTVRIADLPRAHRAGSPARIAFPDNSRDWGAFREGPWECPNERSVASRLPPSDARLTSCRFSWVAQMSCSVGRRRRHLNRVRESGDVLGFSDLVWGERADAPELEFIAMISRVH
jgi:hypothetical protein